MATGVQPRDEDFQFTKIDLETIQDAMKNKKFRDLLADYCEEVRDPANQAIYQKEMVQLEKERGYDVTFINPKGGYVIKTSVAGDRKAFINICSNDYVGKPSYTVDVVDGRRGMNWQIPYSLIPPREDYDQKRVRCVIYDVVFHPDTLRMANHNSQFRELVNKTAMNALQKAYDINLDENNFRFPKSQYKGFAVPAVIRTEDPNYAPPEDEETENLPPELIEKMYPQRNYQPAQDSETNIKQKPPHKQEPSKKPTPPKTQKKNKTPQVSKSTDNGFTIPKYVIKQQKNVDLQEYTYNKDCKEYTAIPNQLAIEVYLPLLSSTKDCTLDVQEKTLKLVSEKPAKYKLEIDLPYPVNDLCGSAKFDKTKHKLIVNLPVIKKPPISNSNMSLKVDSGVDSEECISEDEGNTRKLVTEISSTSAEETKVEEELETPHEELFLDPSLGYLMPTYTHNVLDNTIAFTFHVKNTEPDSVNVKKMDQKVYIKFTTIGSGFVPVHYAALIMFDDEVEFEDVSGEAWDNNVILQLSLSKGTPHTFKIGLDESSVVSEMFDRTVKPVNKDEPKVPSENLPPVVEVHNLGSETNITVSSNTIDEDDDEDEDDNTGTPEREVVWVGTNNDSGAKSILRKPISMTCSYSESSVGDIASSMDYISSDCIPEESSLKKTVRFNDVIAKQVYRYNSSIEAQKKKNQRKKMKKRNQELRRSESEAEDDISEKISKPKLKSALKQRHDSGLADTSDGDTDTKNTPTDLHTFTFDNEETSVFDIVDNEPRKPTEPVIWESEKETDEKPNPSENSDKDDPITCDNIKHNTNLYDPDNLFKGRYLEVQFKNDLIFDLDM